MSGSARHSVSVALLVAGAFFMENLDGTVIATALPHMARSFGTGPVELNVGMTAYMLALAVFIPMSGWVADRFGARTVFGGAIGVFTLSSILCGLSNGLWEFTAARVLQGIGGAMMVPVGRLVVLRTTEKKDLMRSISYITWPGLVAPVLGPPVGGFITTYASWRWIFFLNVPLGLLGMALTAALIRNERGAGVHPFDWTGFFLSGISCTTLMYSLELVGQQTTHWSIMSLYLAASILTGALAVWHFRRHPTPLLNFSSLHLRSFAVTIWGGSLFRIAISVIPFLLPLMFQVGFGMDAFNSGLLVLAVFAGNLGMKTVTTPMIRRFGFRNVLLVNGILTAVSLFACSLLWPGTPTAVTVAVLFIGGLCRSLQFTALNTLGFAEIPPAQMSPTTTFYSMVQQMTMGMGVAAGAIALRLAVLLRGGSPGAVTLTDFHVAFGLVTFLAIASVMDFFSLGADAGAVVSGHKRALKSE
ncbi:MAG: MFS transporter [Verrucomicrobia bacterium]|nr:MFS transporter [Verrucomicrobiota bacterium]